jgi:predicted metal-dependent peptidase
MNPFIEYFNKNKQYTNLIILTDGFIGSNTVKTFKPTLMVLCSKGASVEEVKDNGWGSTIKINLAS